MMKNETQLILCETNEEYEAYAHALNINTKAIQLVRIVDSYNKNESQKDEEKGLFRIDVF